MSTKHIKYGAVGYNPTVSATRLNRFVRDLPESKRQSMFQVAEELKSAGLIETTGSRTHDHNINMYNKRKSYL